MRRLSLLCAILLSASSARADEHRVTDLNSELATDRPAARPISKLRRTGAVLAAIGPGLLVRGAGSYLVHEKRAAKRLLEFAAIGAGGALIGGESLGYSGASPYVMPLLPVLLIGGGIFTTTWWADIATAAGISRTRASARAAPPWSLELATLWLHDPYREAGLLRLRGQLELGRIGLGAEGMVDGENQIRDGAGEVRGRIYGAPATDKIVVDGSRLYVRGGLRVHHLDDDGFSILTGEVEVVGRLDLDRIAGALEGTFAELSSGVGVERTTYFAANDHDTNSLLLGTFAWGAYLGSTGNGELKLFYDHRRDGIVGGGSWFHTAGFVGSLGASIDWMLDRNWAVHGQVEQGTAWLTTFGVRYRGGTP